MRRKIGGQHELSTTAPPLQKERKQLCLHINWRKSYIYPINHVPNMEEPAIILGGEVGKLPTIYLGMPLGAKSKSKGIWDSVLEKCEKKLTRWKSQYLSLRERLTCSITDQLWKIFINLRGIAWAMPSKIADTLFSWEEAGAAARNRERWRIIPSCIRWTIWKERIDVLRIGAI
ncbi:hypothetical protein MTR67_045273 [Solanum verrucosum]|uniref:Uncharacterized protein n=1 Tax=Solanum verrucosum TaxID=315347 RepID=A0AAF0ZW10_SOLVR|nr:hypothetical protein MTR67_045273 [Solanum verrucosum]